MSKLVVLLVFYCTCGLAYSQSITVANCALAEDDKTAMTVDTQVLDQNGELCALLKIQTSETGFSFDVGSLGIIKTVEQPNEIWLYVPYGIKKISINHHKYENLKDYQFPVPIRSGRTYLMVLDLRPTYAPGTGAIDVISGVSGAEVYLDGIKIGYAPLKMGNIYKGTHSLMLRKPGYSLISKDIVVEENNELVIDLTLNMEHMISSQLKSTVHDCSRTYKFVDGKAVIQNVDTDNLGQGGNINPEHFYNQLMESVIDLNGDFVDESDHVDVDSWYRSHQKEGQTGGSNYCIDVHYRSPWDYDYIIYDRNHNVVKLLPREFDTREGPFCEGLAVVQLRTNGKSGFIDITGKLVVSAIYDEASDFSNDMACVRIGQKYGFINRQGELVIDCIYDQTQKFSEGFAFVKSHGKWGFIDKSGKLLTPFIYDKCEDSEFHEGMAVVRMGYNYGYVNKYGNDTF